MTESDMTNRHRAESCIFCKGSGRCAKCGGTGERVFQTRWPMRKRVELCRACRGSGICGLCRCDGEMKH